ncbi:hypothetical protein RT97_14130 [Variovorax paradoxus]|uniref:Uncharacterized protein n=1 Tax=Variovorax paradoxus TaxID=34073 RepID=A0A0D0MHR5_VARPD|nr:hypothetical protein RT97_14130 [Variovorax paradoxus]
MQVGGSDVDLLLNDLSIHGQFKDVPDFSRAIERVMQLRQLAKRFGKDLYCHKNLTQAQVTHHQTLVQVIQALEKSKGQALMQWLTRQGPYWDTNRLHSEDDYLEYDGGVVTDTALGEAAFGNMRGQERRMASLVPSSFEKSPLPVTWSSGNGESKVVDVRNHWDGDELETLLKEAPASLTSWEQLEAVCTQQFDALHFSGDCFLELRGHPFVDGAAKQVLNLLDVLQKMLRAFEGTGQRTALGQQLYQDHFTGDKAWFSDSSDAEKVDFRSELTFKHPSVAGESLFCPWHGKVKTPQIRVHHSWPIRANEPLYVVYIGPKRTKR